MILFFVEIEDKLKKFIGESRGTVRNCAKILHDELKYRFLITTDMLVAAFCDPWSQHIPYLNTILNDRNTTKLNILTNFCSENSIETSDNSNGNSSDHVDTSVSTSSSGSKLLQNLFKKHTKNVNDESHTLEKEINDFEKIQLEFTEHSSILNFWKENQSKFPIMAKIAAIILSRMTSSSSSESGFSTAGW